jgi:wyosine [tRNA(Phe)-imidazoG37] synthetase (radical SAM superfamily)
LGADLVIPSLDAGDAATFQQVNRPHPAVSFERMLGGLEEFRRGFRKPVWLEVLLLKGLTATAAQIKKISDLVERINPDRVQLNTATRPPSEDFALPLSLEELEQAAREFRRRAEVIVDRYAAHHDEYHRACREDILNVLRRRPCTLEDVATGLGLHPNEVVKYLDGLVRQHVLVCERGGKQVFYQFARRTGDKEYPDSDPNNDVFSEGTE